MLLYVCEYLMYDEERKMLTEVLLQRLAVGSGGVRIVQSVATNRHGTIHFKHDQEKLANSCL